MRDIGLADETGWVPVDPATFERRYHNVYSGDITHMTRPDGSHLPKAGLSPKSRARRLRGKSTTDLAAAPSVEGNFLAPQCGITLKQPSMMWLVAKVAFERYCLWRWY
jgi:hypothetical protein